MWYLWSELISCHFTAKMAFDWSITNYPCHIQLNLSWNPNRWQITYCPTHETRPPFQTRASTGFLLPLFCLGISSATAHVVFLSHLCLTTTVPIYRQQTMFRWSSRCCRCLIHRWCHQALPPATSPCIGMYKLLHCVVYHTWWKAFILFQMCSLPGPRPSPLGWSQCSHVTLPLDLFRSWTQMHYNTLVSPLKLATL